MTDPTPPLLEELKASLVAKKKRVTLTVEWYGADYSLSMRSGDGRQSARDLRRLLNMLISRAFVAGVQTAAEKVSDALKLAEVSSEDIENIFKKHGLLDEGSER